MMLSLVDRVRICMNRSIFSISTNPSPPGKPGLFPPTTMVVVEDTEAKLGFGLPPLLRQLYTRVANGGFGPGYGIFGLDGGYADPQVIAPESIGGFRSGTLVEWYFAYRGTDDGAPEVNHAFDSEDQSTLFVDSDPRQGMWNWFDKLLPIANHGCWRLSCIDCSKPSFPVLIFDGQQSLLNLENSTFEGWIEDWLQASDIG